jgi:RimJ/RimL family protein N-acetyltransferase
MIGDPMARGKGYAKQAMVALLNLAFNMLHMNELILKVKDDNKSALAIYESIGFTRIKSSNNLITMIARRCASKTGR